MPSIYSGSDMELVPAISTFLQGVPRTPRAVTEDDPVECFFDLAAYYEHDAEDNHSHSESSSVQTPGLITDSATSPSVLSDSSSTGEAPAEQPPRSQESTRKTLDDVRKHDDHLVWPQADPSQRLPRDKVLQLHASRKKPRPTSGTASRHVKNPVETAQIRKLGACIKCRIEKLKCSDGGVCPSCQSKYGSPLCQRICQRRTLAEIAKQTTPARYTGLMYKEEQAMLRTKCATGRNRWDAAITFRNDDPYAPILVTVFQQCRSQDDDSDLLTFPRDRVPLHGQLIEWVERQMVFERSFRLAEGFESSIEIFVMHYAKAGGMLPQIGLVTKIHHMNCMYRIWRTETLYGRLDSTQQPQPLPPMIQAELRQIVRKALESLERDVLVELDKFLKPSGIPTKARAPMWAALWLLIFVYKGIANTLQLAARAYPSDVHRDSENCRDATEQLFFALLSFYGSHYRQLSNLQAELHFETTYSPPTRVRHELEELFTKTRLDRVSFQHEMQMSPNFWDGLIKTLVVDHEVKRLNRRRNRGRAQPRSLGVTAAPVMYDSDEDGDTNMLDA